jgi:hypothetical protein
MKYNENNRIDENRQLDDLFRQGLENLRPEPSQDLWKGINRKLWWDEISHFTFTNLSKALWIGGIAGMMMVITALMVVVVPQTRSSDNNSFTIINDPVSFNSNSVYYPASYTSDKTNATSMKESDKEAAVYSLSNELNPFSNDLNPSPENAYQESQSVEEILSFMPSIHTPNLLAENDNANQPIINPELIQNLPMGKPPIPQFFSFDFGVTPAVSLNGNPSPETEMNFTSEIGISYHIGRFSLRTGAGLSYVSDDGIYRIEYKSMDSVGFYNLVTSVAVNQQDPKEIIYFTQRVVVYDSLQHIADDQTRNRYTYLQVPLLAGFRLLETTRLGLTLHAGPMVSFLIREKEAMPLIDYPNARIIRIDNNTPTRVKTNWQIWLGLRMDYKINKNFSFFAEPSYKYYLKPVAEQETASAKNPYSIGLGIGIEYNFGHK